MQEFEIKFQVPAAAVTRLRRELKARGATTSKLIASYFDTSDGVLSAHGMSLRLRKEGRRWFQTLKAPGASVVQRLEHNVELRSASGITPVIDASRHDGHDAGQRLRDTLETSHDAALLEQFRVEVDRLATSMRWPGCEVVASFDAGDIQAGGARVAICELELEHLSGGTAELFDLAQLWCQEGGLWIDTRSKARRGAMLVTGATHGAPVKAGLTAVSSDMDGDRLVREVVRSVLEQVLGNASEVAAGGSGEDHVHQLRVGLRRLRTALRELGALAQGIDSDWEQVLARTFGQLGELRDDEAVATAVHDLLVQADAPKLRWTAPDHRVDATALAREPQFQATLIELLRWSLDLPAQSHSVGKVNKHLVKRLNGLHKKVAEAGKSFQTLPTDDQHRARKRLKRLRYLAEFVAPMWGGKRTRRYLKSLVPAQDALGRHNDIVVAAGKFVEDGLTDPQALYAAGFLTAHQALTARTAQAPLADLARAKRFWMSEPAR